MRRSHAVADQLGRRRAARDHPASGRGGRDLVLLGDAAVAAASAATECMRSMPFAARSTTSPTASGRWSTSSRRSPTGGTRSRRSIAGRPRHLVARALRDPVAALSSCAERTFSPSSTAWRWMPARTSGLPTSRRSTFIARASRAPSAISRCTSSAMRGEAAHAVADSLGRALQLTNILRDLDEDAGRRPALSAAGNPRPARDRELGPGGGLAPSGVAGGLPRSRGHRRRPLSARPTAR